MLALKIGGLAREYHPRHLREAKWAPPRCVEATGYWQAIPTIKELVVHRSKIGLLTSALCDKRTYASQQFTPSFNHVVDDGEHAWRYPEAEVLRCLQVDDQLEFGRLL